MRETEASLQGSPASCAQEVCPCWCLLGQHSTDDTAGSLPESGLQHHPRAAHTGMESLPVLGNYIISPVRCCCSLLLCMWVVKLLAALFPVRMAVIIISWKNVISQHSGGTCLFITFILYRHIFASVTATEYNIVSNQKLNFNFKTYNLIAGKTFIYLMSLAK